MGDVVNIRAGELPADSERAPPPLADLSDAVLLCPCCGFDQYWLPPDGRCQCARCGTFSPVRRHFNIEHPPERNDHGQAREEARPQEPDPRQAG